MDQQSSVDLLPGGSPETAFPVTEDEILAFSIPEVPERIIRAAEMLGRSSVYIETPVNEAKQDISPGQPVGLITGVWRTIASAIRVDPEGYGRIDEAMGTFVNSRNPNNQQQDRVYRLVGTHTWY